jgi:limonene 1,2-monooxygenase
MAKMRFGLFMAPFHVPVGRNPTLAYERDTATIRLADDLGFDEAWIGEHHSCGGETIPDPTIFIAHVAAQTRRIKLGTGVVSLPYHNPLWIAERILFLDHLTRGRVMLGCGPGALPTDAAMIGLAMNETRDALEEDMAVVMHLLTSDQPISVETKRYRLVNAICQIQPYSDPLFDVAVTAVASPSGPRLAGKHGVGVLSFSATEAASFSKLREHWEIAEERAAEFSTSVDREKWRLVGPMHLAETREQAIRDVRHGFDAWCEYRQTTIPTTAQQSQGETFEEHVEWLTGSGAGVIGTPDDAIAQIERLDKQSGGFGCYLLNAHEWANPDATRRSYELFANHVMPHFQRSTMRLLKSEALGKATRGAAQKTQEAAVREFAEAHAKAPASTQ